MQNTMQISQNIKNRALPGWLSQLEHHPVHQKVVGLISSQGVYGRQPIDVFHIDVSLPLSPLPFFFKINKHILGWGVKIHLKIELPCNSTILLLGIYLKKFKTLIWKDVYTPVLIAALFTVVKIWKQSRSPLRDKWIKKRWYIYTMEYYSTIKRMKS